MKKVKFLVILLVVFNMAAKAEEGLWIPMLLDQLNF